MKATLEDLRGALRAEADAAAYPDVDALVVGARLRVAASRRRRLAVLGAATAAVLVVGGLVMTRPTHQALPQPASPGPFTLNAGGAGFPEYQQGMKRLTVVDAPMLERIKGSISVPTTPGRLLVLRMSCTPTDNMNEWNSRIIFAKFAAPGGAAKAACGMEVGGYEPIGIATGAKTAVLADVFINHEPSPSLPSLFKDAQIHVAFYESVPFEDYPLPPRPADLDTDPNHAWSSDPGTLRVLGPRTAQEANRPLTFTQPFDPKLGWNLEVRGPGRLRLLINGKDITKQIGLWLTQDKFMSSWTYDSVAGYQLPLDPAAFSFLSTGAAGPPTKPGTPVTVTIEPQDFAGPDWRITVFPGQPDPPTGG